MVVDALLAADSFLRISEQIYDPQRYVFLTDSILEEIERSQDPVRPCPPRETFVDNGLFNSN